MLFVWIIGLLVLVTSIVIQYKALKSMAFSRSMFLSGMAFFVSFLVAFLIRSSIAWILFGIFQAIAWGFLFLMTYFSLRKLQEKKRR